MANTNYRVGQDVSPMKAYRKAEEELESRYSFLIAIVVLFIIVGVIMNSCVDAIVKTAEMDEQEARKRVFVEQVYQRPAAFRKASPTQAEMDHLHGLLQVMAVNK